MAQAETLNSLADPVYKRSKNIVPYKTTYLLRNVLSITGKNKKSVYFFFKYKQSTINIRICTNRKNSTS